MNAADFPEGSLVKAFFQKVTRKEGDKKIKENHIIAISFVEVGGQRISDEERRVYFCVPEGPLIFRAFGLREN